MAMIIEVDKNGAGGYKTITAAVQAAQPGDTILVHGGVYREEVVFPRGGRDEEHRIVLRAAEEESVILTGAELVEEDAWIARSGGCGQEVIYCLTLDRNFFGSNAQGDYFNPFAETWMSKGITKEHFFTCGCVWQGEKMLTQAWTIEEVKSRADSWYAEVDEQGTTKIWANFGGANPHGTEINCRMQCITAEWNLGYITIDGFHVTRGCGPKTIDFWMTNAKPMCGAIAVNGGHHWIIENCEVSSCRGVAIDFGCGSARMEVLHGGEPALYGYHLIRGNNVHDNATNGIMAYRGAYTEMCGNQLINNNALNTELLSEAYIKDVSGGWGLYIHDNYFYSDQEWSAYPIWLDSECDGCRVSRNIIWCRGEEHGFTALDLECNQGWNLIDNNVFVGIGFHLNTSTSTYMVNNLWLDMNPRYRVWPSRNNTKFMGTEGFDGYTRCMRVTVPGTLQTIGSSETSRWQCFNNNCRMLGNTFFDRGLTNIPVDTGLEMTTISGAKPAIEPETAVNGVYGEMVLNEAVGDDGCLLADPNYSGGTWKAMLPSATNEEKAAMRYMGIMAWIPADENSRQLLDRQLGNSMDAGDTWGNTCDDNLYLGGAQCIDHPEYGVAHGYLAEQNSTVLDGGSYRVMASPESFELELMVPEEAAAKTIQRIDGCTLGASPVYIQAAAAYNPELSVEDLTPPDVNVDFFGGPREQMTAPGPFAKLVSGSNRFICWPKEE